MHAKKQIGTQETGGSGRLHEHTQHSAAIREDVNIGQWFPESHTDHGMHNNTFN